MASKNKRKQTFKEYLRSWDFIKPSRKGENHARCTLCSADFSIAASGRYDITQHIATAKHRSNAERKDSNQSILQCVSSKEACLCMFLKNTGFYWKIQVCGLQNTGLYFQRLACLMTPHFWDCVLTECPSLWKCEPYTSIHLILEYPPPPEKNFQQSDGASFMYYIPNRDI